MFVVHKTCLIKQKKSKKIMQCPTTKCLSFSFDIGFFFKYINYFSFITNFFFKHIFLMNFQPKFLNFQLAINSIDVYQYH